MDPNTPAPGQQVLAGQEQDADLQEAATGATGPAAANGAGPHPIPAKALAQLAPCTASACSTVDCSITR